MASTMPMPSPSDAESASNEPAACFETPPSAALAVIAAHDGPVIVDLDETLYLRNSTEDFIDLARPALMAVALLRILDMVKIWQFSGGAVTRDVWRVQLIRWLFPWTMRRWLKHVSRLAQSFANAPLLNVVKSLPTPPVIVTAGFAPIVEPLIAALGLSEPRIIAARAGVFADRLRGKLPLALERLGESTVRRSLVVSDSLQDLPLFQYCSRGLLTVWPAACYRPAFTSIYLPGSYISRVKRPGEHYLRRSVLQDNFLLWVLSSVALSPSPVRHIAGLLLLLISFWVIYEMGYVDNDRAAAKFEQKPTLTQEFHDSSVATPFWQPWVWALACGVAGIFVLRSPASPSVRDFVLWPLALLATFGWFALYNRSNKRSRVWMYVGLQLARTAAFVIMVPILPIGAMALAAHILAQWLPYYLYRMVNRDWPLAEHFGVARLTIFIVLAVMMASAIGWAVVLNWTTLALLLWHFVRSRKEIIAIFTNYARIDRADSSFGKRP